MFSDLLEMRAYGFMRHMSGLNIRQQRPKLSVSRTSGQNPSSLPYIWSQPTLGSQTRVDLRRFDPPEDEVGGRKDHTILPSHQASRRQALNARNGRPLDY